MSIITTINAGDQITNSRTDINTNFANLNADKFEISNVDTDTTLSANSDAKVASQKAVKTFIQATAGTTFLVPTGAILPYGGSSAPANYLLCDGSLVSTATYSTLYGIIGTTYGNVGPGLFRLPDLRSRIPLGAGTGTVSESGANADVDTTADTLTVASNNSKWVTGMTIVFTLASGTITGLTSGNTYYVIRASSTTIKLASSLANAQNGTAIDLTAKSSPSWTITGTLTTRTRGEIGGEEAHAMSSTELLAHTHGNVYALGSSTGPGSTGATTDSTHLTGSTGGNAAMNIMNPFVGVNYIIKT